MRPTLQGVAVDTEKVLDNGPQAKALEALLALGFQTKQVATWASGLAHLDRHVSLNGAVAKQPFKSTNGVPQEDPMNVIAAGALLG